MTDPVLTRLLPEDDGDVDGAGGADRIERALSADPALAGRAAFDGVGTVTLTSRMGGTPPASAKERRRWEIHVRLRLSAELGKEAAGRITVRWA